MLISAETTLPISIFFSPKEAQLLFRQLQKSSVRNIAALKCESRKTKCWAPWNPLMQLSVKERFMLMTHDSIGDRKTVYMSTLLLSSGVETEWKHYSSTFNVENTSVLV